MTAASAPYTCRYCRMTSDGSGPACPFCGAPVDVRARQTDSGWVEQPAIRDMARIQMGRSTCQIEGTYVPTADFGLVGDDWIYFSHHVLLWTDPVVRLQAMPMAGGWNRKMAGLPLVMMQAAGPAPGSGGATGPAAGGVGHLALSDDHPGEIIALPLQPGRSVMVREGRFLAATGNVGYRWEQSNVWYTTRSGDDTEWHYPLGRYVDQFGASSTTPGLLLLHSPGNTFIRDLAPGQTILIQPTAFLYWDLTVGVTLHFEYPRSQGLTWSRSYSYRTVWLRVTGPGRVAVQSVFARPESSQAISRHSPATAYRW